MYKKLLQEYFNYLGNQQPRNGVILFHLRTFAEWLEQFDDDKITITNEKYPDWELRMLEDHSLAWLAIHKLCGELGMDSGGEYNGTSLNQVLDFITSLKNNK